MGFTRVGLRGTIALLAFIVCAGAVLGGKNPVAAAEPQKKGTVAELQKERLAVLKQLAKVTAADYKIGRVTFDRVHATMQAVLEAELEICDSDKERLTILENAVGLAKEYEKVAESLYKTGRVGQSDILMAQVHRLEAEIALERAKAKSAAPSR